MPPTEGNRPSLITPSPDRHRPNQRDNHQTSKPQARSAIKFDLFADAAHKHKIDTSGDPLRVNARHIDFGHLTLVVDDLLPRDDATKGGHPAFPTEVMAANDSPAPVFESDDDRLSFVIRWPCHPLTMSGLTATDQATGEVERLLRVVDREMSRQQIQNALALKHEDHFRSTYLKPALALGVIEMITTRQTTQQQPTLPPTP